MATAATGFFASAGQLADALPDGIVVVDAAGTIVTVNRRLAEMVGYPDDLLVGQSIDKLIPSDQRSAHAAHRTRFSEQPTIRPMGTGLDTVCQRADGSIFPTDIALSPMTAGGDPYTVATVRDDTERRALEDTRRETEERFRLLVESVSATAIVMLDAEGRVSSWNTGAKRLKGYESDEIIGQSFSVFYTPEDVASGKPEKMLAEAAATGRAEDFGRRVRRDGSRFQASVSITASFDSDGRLRGFTKITRDITAALEARDGVERVHLLEQRDQLARDLHDGVIQSLFAVGLGLQGLLSRADDPIVAQRLQQSVAALDETITELRSFIFGLGTQPTPMRVRLELERLTNEVRTRSGIDVNGVIEPAALAALDTNGSDLLLVAREAMSNVERHSRASSCILSLRFGEDNMIELVVQDNGQGFDTSARSGGLGLTNARARAAEMGAQYTVDSSAAGTTVRLRVPVNG